MPKASRILKVGDKAPDFTLKDAATGNEVSLRELLDRTLLIIFGRGTW